MVGGSAFMYHISNSMFKSSIPSADDIMKQNPDLMRQFQEASMNSMQKQAPGFSGFMGSMMGGGKGNRGPQMDDGPPPFPGPHPSTAKMPNMSTSIPDLDTILSDIDN